MRAEFKSDQSHYNKQHAGGACQGKWFGKENYSNYERTDHTYPSPNRVGGAQRYFPHRQSQLKERLKMVV